MFGEYVVGHQDRFQTSPELLKHGTKGLGFVSYEAVQCIVYTVFISFRVRIRPVFRKYKAGITPVNERRISRVSNQ